MRTVLIVDDEPKIVQLARDYLEHAGFTVLTASDGPSAIHAVRTRRRTWWSSTSACRTSTGWT
ncbi:MAG TPA: hypothetical protein VEX41_11070 [Candidatus Eisenbacteria bacterium]|nr:hypothetical protein [Candidatus Eisenbacteria bacterium]